MSTFYALQTGQLSLQNNKYVVLRLAAKRGSRDMSRSSIAAVKKRADKEASVRPQISRAVSPCHGPRTAV